MGYCWSEQDASIGGGFLRVATEQVAKAVLNADAISDPPADRIHSARRHCKRLRGLFRLVRADFADYAKANAQVRDAAAHLSAVRDARVTRQTLEKLYEWAGQPAPDPGEDTSSPARDETALLVFRREIIHLLGEMEGWKVGRMDQRTLGRGFKRCYGQAGDAARKTLKRPSDEAFHSWRKLVKYHACHLILLKPCLGEAGEAEIEQVEQLAEVLGRHHDLAVLREVAEKTPEQLGHELDVAFVEANAKRLQQQLAANAHRLAAGIFARPPAVARETLEGRWQAWRSSATETVPA